MWQHGKVSQVIVDGETRWCGLYWKVFPQELVVGGAHPSRAVNADNLLVEFCSMQCVNFNSEQDLHNMGQLCVLSKEHMNIW